MREVRQLLMTVGVVVVMVLGLAGGAVAAPPTGPIDVNAFVAATGASNQVNNLVFTVPAGKRLVIEYVSAKGVVPFGDSVSGIHINNPIVHFLVVTPQGVDIFGKNVFTAAQTLHTAIGPFAVATDVIVRMERNTFGPGTDASLSVTLAGQLVDP
jgi:hypothetical protein